MLVPFDRAREAGQNDLLLRRVVSAARIGGPAVLLHPASAADASDSEDGEDEDAPGATAATTAAGGAGAVRPEPRLSAQNLPLPPKIRVIGRTAHENSPPEALVYVPGYNAPCQMGVLCIGQLLAMGDFPPHIKPFVFSWPAGRELTYFTAVNVAQCERNQRDFCAFVASIIETGVRDIHFMTHSVGVHTFISALPRLQGMLQTVEQQNVSRNPRSPRPNAAAAGPTARMTTVTLMSPDYPLDQFVNEDFAILRSLCSHITVYGDQSDRALRYSEIFNGVLTIGKNPFKLVKPGTGTRQRTRRPPFQRNSPNAPHSVDAEAPQSFLSWVTNTVSGRNSETAQTSEYFSSTAGGNASLGMDLESRVRQAGEPLDMDVVDTSWMDQNVQSLRHNYFNVNRWMIDDIRESVVQRRRAHMRTGRMTHRRGNVWSFIGAPKYVVMTGRGPAGR